MLDKQVQEQVDEISRLGPVDISDSVIQGKLEQLADLVKNLDDNREEDILYVLAHFTAIAEMITSVEDVSLSQDRLGAVQSKFDHHAENAGQDFSESFDNIMGNFIDRD